MFSCPTWSQKPWTDSTVDIHITYELHSSHSYLFRFLDGWVLLPPYLHKSTSWLAVVCSSECCYELSTYFKMNSVEGIVYPLKFTRSSAFKQYCWAAKLPKFTMETHSTRYISEIFSVVLTNGEIRWQIKTFLILFLGYHQVLVPLLNYEWSNFHILVSFQRLTSLVVPLLFHFYALA